MRALVLSLFGFNVAASLAGGKAPAAEQEADRNAPGVLNSPARSLQGEVDTQDVAGGSVDSDNPVKSLMMGDAPAEHHTKLATDVLKSMGYSTGYVNGNGNGNVEMGSGCSPLGGPQSRVCDESYTICGPTDVDVLASHCCKELRGDLHIQPAQRCEPSGVTEWSLSLEGLSSITRITGDLRFVFSPLGCMGNSSLVNSCLRMDSFHGLHNLQQVGGDVVFKGRLVCSPQKCVTNLSSLQALEEIGGSLHLNSVVDGEALADQVGWDGDEVAVPHLRRVNGTVQLHGFTSVDMSGLASLREVGGDFELKGALRLTSLAGLENLTTIGGSLLVQDTTPTSDNFTVRPDLVLHGLGNLTLQGLQLRGTSRLRSLDGLRLQQQQLQTIHIERAHLLENIEAFKALQEVAGNLVIHETAISSLQGLRSLRSVGSDLQISGNAGLRDLNGLAALREILGNLLVHNNPGLSSLRGFSTADLPAVWGVVEIVSNKALQSLEGLEFERASQVVVSKTPLQHLGTSFSGWSADGCPGKIQGRSLKIDPLTARPRCATPHEWERALSQWMNVESGEPKGWEEWHANGCGTGHSTCWLGADCYIDVSGVNLWDNASGVALPLCGLSCGPCRNQNQAFALPGSQSVNVRELLRGAAPGKQVLCHCGGAAGRGPVSEISLVGPSDVKSYSCVRGHTCSLAVPGEGFSVGSSVQIMSVSCSGDHQAAEAVFQPGSGTFEVLDWVALARQKSGPYLVCWTSPPNASCPTCAAPDTLEIGTLMLLGPFDVQLEATMDGRFRLANLGVGTRDQDKLEILETCGQSWLHRLGATSSDLQFEVDLDRSIVQATQYHLCWCRPVNGVNGSLGSLGSQGSQCTSPQDFMVDFGSLLVKCPAQEALTEDGCQLCPAGTSLRTADSVCTLDQAYVALLSAQSLLLFTAVTLAVALLFLPLPIEDCYTQNGKVVVEFTQPHWLCMYGHKSFSVSTQGTSHRALKLPLRARVRSKEALELLLPKGELERHKRVDESTGALRLSLARELMHVGWPAPLGVTLVLLLVLVVGFLVAIPQQLKHTGIGSGSAVLAAIVVGGLLRRQTPTTLERKLLDFRAQLLEQNPSPKAVPKGPTRAVELKDLYDIMEAFGSYVRDRNAYYMNKNVFQAITARYKLSYAEVVGPKQVQWFVSHFWGNPFTDLCNALRKHAETVFIPGQGNADSAWQTTYWICFLSNNQHQVLDELGRDWSESSFYITLKSGFCRGVCMILDEGVQPLTRSWCIFELLQTLLLENNDPHFAGLLMCTETGTLNYGQGTVEVAFNLVQRIADLDLASASASNQNDKDMINAQVIQELGSFDTMKDLVRVKLHAILVTAQGTASANFQRLFQLVQPSAVATPTPTPSAAVGAVTP